MTDSDRKNKLAQLRALDRSADQLRQELGISHPGSILWRGDTWDAVVLAEADGYGGAVVRELRGRYPVDFDVAREQRCVDEAEACRLAAAWVKEKTRHVEPLGDQDAE